MQPQFLETVPKEYILMPNIKGKEKPWGIGKGWSLQEAQHQCPKDRYIACHYALKDTPYVVVDIDEPNYTLDQLFEDTGIDSCYVKGNTKGFHVWVELKDGKQPCMKRNYQNVGKPTVIDYLGEKVFERVGKEWVGDHACYLTEEQLNKCFHTDKIKKEKQSSNSLLKTLVGLIDVKYCDDRNDWLKMVCAMKKCKFTEQETKEWSMKSDRFTEEGFTTLWNSYQESNLTSTEGTIRHYAKLSNPTEYAKLSNSTPEDSMNIQTLIELTSSLEIPESTQEELDAIEKYNAKEKKKRELELKEKKTECSWLKFKQEMTMKSDYFEHYHAKIIQPPGFLRLSNQKAYLLSPKDLTVQYEHVTLMKPSNQGPHSVAFTDEWRKRPQIRTFENVDFLPPPLPCLPSTFNMYFGMRAERLPPVESVDISLFHSHLHILCGEEEKATDYVLKYLAHMVQCPGTLPRVALVFMSSQGVGKNIFFENFAKYILGQDLYLQTDNMEKIIGKFNMNYNKLMVIMDEVQTKDSFTNSEAIKNMITAETLLWERKGCDPITITNVARDIMFSNGLLPVKIECTDRRFMLMECKNTVRNNTEYFKRLYAFFKDDRNARAIYDMLMNVDLSAWDSTNDRVITKAYKDVQSATTPPMALFLETKLLEYEHYGSYDLGGQDAVDLTKFSSQELFQEFSAWLSQNGFTKMEYTITKYGREIVSYQGIEKRRLACGITIVVDYKALKAGLIEKGYHTSM